MLFWDHETVEFLESCLWHNLQFDHYWRFMLAKQAAAVLVSTQAIGNNCYTSFLANFLDVFQLIVSLFWTSALQHTHYEPLGVCTPEDVFLYWAHCLTCISELIRLVLWKIWCLHHGGVWLHHVNAFVFGSIPNFAQACESSWKLGCVFSICLSLLCFFLICRVVTCCSSPPPPTNPQPRWRLREMGGILEGSSCFLF